MIRRFTALMVVAILLVFAGGVIVSAADVKPGSVCTKKNQTRTVKGFKYKCKKSGKKLKWSKGVKVTVPTTSTSNPETSTPTVPTTSTSNPETSTPEVAPVLSFSPVDLAGTYNESTHQLGSLKCTPEGGLPGVAQGTCFSPFGYLLAGQSVGLPHYSYRLKLGGNIYAVAPGIVDRVERNAGWDDYEISTVSRTDGVYGIIYDHVSDVRVAVGSVVKPGDVIASIATDGFFELQINKDERRIGGRASHVCPQVLGTSTFNQEHVAALAANNQANPTATFPSVCLVDTINP